MRGCAFGKGPVESPNGTVDMGAEALVHGVHIAERGRIEEHGVPGRLGPAGIGIAVEREISGEPGRIDEIAEGGEIFEKKWREECGRGEDDELRLKFGVTGENADAAG